MRINTDASIKSIKKIKQKGNVHFASRNFEKAIDTYKHALQEIEAVLDIEMDEKILALKVECLLNLVTCFLELKQFKKSLFYSIQATTIDPSNYEGHFRKGLSLMHLDKLELAKESFEKALSLSTNTHQRTTIEYLLSSITLSLSHQKMDEDEKQSDDLNNFGNPKSKRMNSLKNSLIVIICILILWKLFQMWGMYQHAKNKKERLKM